MEEVKKKRGRPAGLKFPNGYQKKVKAETPVDEMPKSEEPAVVTA